MSTAIQSVEPLYTGTSTAPLPAAELPSLEPPGPAWPGTVREVGGIQLHVRSTGDRACSTRGSPPATAVYVHGLGGSALNWTDLATALAPEVTGHAVDLPGFGRTEPPPGFGFTLEEHADVLERFVAALDSGPVHLFGNSMGGAVCVLLAARRPDLVRTLTLVSPAVRDLRPHPGRLSDPRLALAMLPVVGRTARAQLATMRPRERVQQVVRLCFHEPDAVPEARLAEAEHEAAERMSMPWASAALNGSTLGILRAWARTGPRSLATLTSRVRVPTLLIWGERDRVIGVRRARSTVRRLPYGRLLVLRRTGHVAQMERPELVARAALGMWAAVDNGTW